MTYCRAWKKEKNVFLISDTCISEKDGESKNSISSFGERFGVYNNYAVSESEIKIVAVNDKIAIAYSGEVDIAKEAINNFINSLEFSTIKESLDKIEINYSNDKFELVIICKELDEKIYYFDGHKYKEIEDYIEIGSGKDNKEFSELIKKFIHRGRYDVSFIGECCLLNKNGKFNADTHLVNVISYVQYLSLGKDMFTDGVGGLFGGLYLDDTIKWCKDLLYYTFDGSLDEFKTVSVIARYNTMFSYSDFNDAIRYYCNLVKEDEGISSDIYTQNSIIKSLSRSFPDYVIIYNRKNNLISVLETNKWPYNSIFKMWIRRKESGTKYGFLLSQVFVCMDDFVSIRNDNELELYNIECKKVPFETREDSIGVYCTNIEDVEDFDVDYDYDLRVLELKDNYISSNSHRIDDTIEKYHNIILVDYRYLYNAICEKYEEYKFAEVKLEQLRLELLIEKFIVNIASREFDEYGFFFIKGQNDKEFIDEFSVSNWIKQYDNCTLIEVNDDKYQEELLSIMLQSVQKYYFDESYFTIDKLILFCDNSEVNEILYYVPKVNTEAENRDIILIRNLNHFTKMDGNFKYIVIDYAIVMMLGYSMNEFGLLESGYDPRECK